MSFDYFYGQQSDLFTFYRVPKVLFTNERFWNISADAKMLYGILLDRMSLSAKNGWIDKNGRVYIIFTIDEAKMALNCAEQKAIKLLSELEKKAGLIERKRQGLGKPNLIYVKNFISAVDHRTFLCPVPYIHKVGIRGKIRNFHDCGKCDIIQLNGRNKTTGKERAPMKVATSIQERLWELRKDKGLNLEELSKLTGISKSALGSYEKEDYKEINHGNLITLADFYGVSVDYLLCRTENREQINTPLTELHLNDEMVALLKSGRINNRLLCELATHKNFIKFLADIEIYVDGIATMQIQNLNTLVDTVRHEIIERYRPGEDDPHLKVLQAAHISDDEYFSHMVLDDLNLIIRDIRETHKKDSESAPQTTVANELKENLEAVENFKGSRDEKLVVLYCKQLGINYKNLSDEEFRWLIRILKKSKKMGTPISQRKKR